MRLRSAIAASVALGAAVASPGASAASYGSASIVSVSADAQFQVADSSVVSQGGHYVAFRGSVDGHTGLWRRDLISGALDPVAVDLPGIQFPNLDPQAPSISSDGRYVAFNTRARLDPQNDTAPSPRPWNVYVRDMALAPGAVGAYTLASAVDGGTQALSYVNNGNGTGARIAGAQLNPAVPGVPTAPGGALTADGRTVVFSVDSQSNLVNPSSAPATPPSQVAVRNLDAHTTKLVSIDSSGGPVNWTSSTGGPGGGAVSNDDAVISADGTTVAWVSPLGAIEKETHTLPGEEDLGGGASLGAGDPQAVWRRLADGAAAPTLRITSDVDPLRPDCPAGAAVVNHQLPAACAGPLDTTNALAFSHLALSGDGYEALLLSPDQLRGSSNGQQQEAYLIDLHPGLTRNQATRALTQARAFSGGAAPGEAPIAADAISSDGNTIALSTQRTRFDLASPSYVGPPRPQTALGNELYILDRARDTLDLVTLGFDGSFADYAGACAGGTLSPSLSADGSLAVFDSCADNLVFGDGNGASDVFVAAHLSASTRSAPMLGATVPLAPVTLTPLWLLRATARALANGSLELDIVVPSAGNVSVVASARVQSRPARGRHKALIASRTVAAAHGSAPGGGLMTLKLNLGAAYSALARSPAGLHATARLAFRASDGAAALNDTIAVTFHAKPSRSSHSPRPHARKRRPSRPATRHSSHTSSGHKGRARRR